MYTIKEQVAIILYFLIFGIFTVTMYRIFSYFINKTRKKKVFKYIIELLFWMLLIYFSSRYLLVSTKGNIPLYGILFYILGIAIYFILLDKSMYVNLDFIGRYLLIVIQELLYSKEVMIVVKKIIKKKSKISRRRKRKKYEENNIIDASNS